MRKSSYYFDALAKQSWKLGVILLSLFFATSLMVNIKPVVAEAGSNFGAVQNESGAPIVAYCDYGKGGYRIYERIGPYNPYKSGYGAPCGNDTDQVGVYQARCVYFSTGFAGTRRGPYLITPGARYKISGVQVWWVFARTTGNETSYSKRCNTQPSGTRGA